MRFSASKDFPCKGGCECFSSLSPPSCLEYEVMAGTPAAILHHWANLERKSHNRRAGWRDGRLLSPEYHGATAALDCLPHSRLLLQEREINTHRISL